MNWMGEKIKKYVNKKDIVLDLGCGIMQATTGIYDGKKSLKCKTILGVELVEKYIDKVKYHYPTIRTDVRDTDLFMDDSYDVVICTDVLEHLPLTKSIDLLKEMKRITRHTVIIYTPKEYEENGDNVENAWNLGRNILQHHKCLITPEILKSEGYSVEVTKIDGNLFGVWKK